MRFAQWPRKHPACGSPEESNPPFPGSPSLREDDGLASLTEQGRIYGFIFLCAPPRPLRAFRGRSSLRALTGSLLALLPHLRCSSVCQIISSQHCLQHSPLQAPQGGRRRRMSSCILPGDPCSTPHPPLGGDTGRFLSHK